MASRSREERGNGRNLQNAKMHVLCYYVKCGVVEHIIHIKIMFSTGVLRPGIKEKRELLLLSYYINNAILPFPIILKKNEREERKLVLLLEDNNTSHIYCISLVAIYIPLLY